jgi:hypothetical protein
VASNPAEEYLFLRVIKIRNEAAFGVEVKLSAPYRKILQHVKIIIIIIIIWLYSPSRALAYSFLGFLTVTFLRGWVVSPAPNPQPGGPGHRIYDPRGQGGPAVPPGTGYPF